MDEVRKEEKEIIELPMLPMRNIVVFPYMTIPFFIGRKQSIKALEGALDRDRKVFVVAQTDPMIEEPAEDELYEVGTVGSILQIMRLPNGTIKALFEAKHRGRRLKVDLDSEAYSAEVEILETFENKNDAEIPALVTSVKEEVKTFIKKIAKNADSADKIVTGTFSAGQTADLIAPLLSISIEKQQELLETLEDKKRLEMVYGRMLEEGENKKLEQKLKERVQGQIGKTQKDYYLNEQMKAIQKELGSGDSGEEFGELEEKIESCGMPESVQVVAKKELKKLKMMPPTSSEANIVRTYIDWLVTVPWENETVDDLSIDHAQTVLDEDHWGLEKVKERIIEFIAIGNLVGSLRGPIICLAGPPGVGKSSLAKSIARSVGRKFVRMSLGGVRDEAEIRGHRRTYIGAMPGKIIQSMKKAKTSNPVILLDEIDKMGQSHLGDPSSALLEVLDPEQNATFMDHYLEVEYDLSNVMFICTANTKQDIPLPLIDRMEVINLSGYSEIEKEKIAEKYLVPKQMKENGLTPDKVSFEKDGILEVIRSYTREAGVRNLERTVAKVCRKAVTEIVKGRLKQEQTPQAETVEADAEKSHTDYKDPFIPVTGEKVREYLGVTKFEYGKLDKENEVGIINGLAWTSVGGEVLTIEVNTMKGNGKIILTGKLGDVMKESAQTAHSFVRANANSFGIYSKLFTDLDIHVHVPEGATPKDGPSAGVAITCALVSALTGIPIRKDHALTGEVTLRGKILPIGGLKEKMLAAKRLSITHVLIPEGNEKDLSEISDEIQKGLTVRPLKNVREAVELMLEHRVHPVVDEDLDESTAVATPPVAGSTISAYTDSKTAMTHS